MSGGSIHEAKQQAEQSRECRRRAHYSPQGDGTRHLTGSDCPGLKKLNWELKATRLRAASTMLLMT
jgi:hypothetical protein